MDVLCENKKLTFQIELYSETMPEYVQSILKLIKGVKVSTGSFLGGSEIIKMSLKLNQMMGPILFCNPNGKTKKKMDGLVDSFFADQTKWEKRDPNDANTWYRHGQLITYHMSKEAYERDDAQCFFAIVTDDCNIKGKPQVFGQCRHMVSQLDKIVQVVRNNNNIQNRHVYADVFRILQKEDVEKINYEIMLNIKKHFQADQEAGKISPSQQKLHQRVSQLQRDNSDLEQQIVDLQKKAYRGSE